MCVHCICIVRALHSFTAVIECIICPSRKIVWAKQLIWFLIVENCFAFSFLTQSLFRRGRRARASCNWQIFHTNNCFDLKRLMLANLQEILMKIFHLCCMIDDDIELHPWKENWLACLRSLASRRRERCWNNFNEACALSTEFEIFMCKLDAINPIVGTRMRVRANGITVNKAFSVWNTFEMNGQILLNSNSTSPTRDNNLCWSLRPIISLHSLKWDWVERIRLQTNQFQHR